MADIMQSLQVDEGVDEFLLHDQTIVDGLINFNSSIEILDGEYSSLVEVDGETNTACPSGVLSSSLQAANENLEKWMKNVIDLLGQTSVFLENFAISVQENEGSNQ